MVYHHNFALQIIGINNYLIVELIKDYITNKKTVDWHLHFANMRIMTTLFTATAHMNYTKSVRLYCKQWWSYLKIIYKCMISFHSLDFSLFMKKWHICGSCREIWYLSRYWWGHWRAEVALQEDMELLNQSGLFRLTQCIGVPGIDFTKLLLWTSEQHVELSRSHIKWNNWDVTKHLPWFDINESFFWKTSAEKSVY